MGPWIATICVVWVSPTVSNAPQSVARPSTALSLGAKLAREFRHRSSTSLLRFAESAIGRLVLDEQEFVVDTTVDLADLVAAATSLDLLLERKTPPPRTALLAARAASVMHRLGWLYDNDPELRRRIARLGASAADKASMAASAGIRDAIAGFRKVGRDWFRHVFPTALRLHPKEPDLLNLHGLWLKQEGQFTKARARFESALSLRPRPAYALNLYEVALTRGLPGLPQLRHQLTERLPALKAELMRLDARHRDRQQTAKFERGPIKKSAEALLAQAERYLRLGRQPRGDALVREVQERVDLTRPLARRAALYWMESRRDGRALELINARKDRGDPAWESLRLTLAVRTRLEALAATEPSVTPEIKKSWAKLDEGLQRLRDKSPTAALHADIVALFMAVREVNAAKASGDLKAEARSRASLARLRRVLKDRHRSDLLAALARAGSVLATDTPVAALAVMRDAVADLPKASRSQFSLMLAEQEVGLGLRGAKAAWVTRGLQRAKGLGELNGSWEFRRRYLVHVGGWLAQQAAGRPASLTDTRRLVGVLKQMVDRSDTTTPLGRSYAGGVGLSLGALAVAVGDGPLAHQALQWSRRFLDRPLTDLAGAVAGLSRYQDAYGAGVHLDRALRHGNGPHLLFTLHKWRALAANRRGDVKEARVHLKQMLLLAPRAGMPEQLSPRSGVPLTLGSLAMVVAVAPLDSPQAVRVEMSSLVTILPSFSHDLKEIRRLLKQLPVTP